MSSKHTSIQLHVMWSTAKRSPWIALEWRDRMYENLGAIVKHRGGRLLRAGGTADHIHACLTMPLTVTVADMVKAMKVNSCRWIQDNCPHAEAFTWQKGYGAFSVGKSAEVDLCRYILEQEEHHRMWSFQQEFLSLLDLYHIDYDARHLWD